MTHKTVVEVIEAWARQHEFEARHEEGGPAVQVAFPCEADSARLAFVVEGDTDGVFQVFAYLDPVVPQDKRVPMAALLAHVNPGLRLGTFELTPNGHVRFRLGADAEHAAPRPEFIDGHVQCAIATWTFHLGAVLAVMYTSESPLEAFQQNLARQAAEGAPPVPPEQQGPERAALPPPESARWLTTAGPEAGWDAFAGTAPIREWATSLARQAPMDPDLQTRAVVFIGPNGETCEDVARLAAAEAGYRYAFLPANEVLALPPAMLATFERLAPVLVFLEMGIWQAPPEAEVVPEEREDAVRALQAALVKQIQLYDPAHPVVFCTSQGVLTNLAEKLMEAGAFDRAFAVPEPTPEARGHHFLGLVGLERCAETLRNYPAKVGKAIAVGFRSRTDTKLAALHLRRRVARTGRKAEFVDLVEAFTHGLVESADHQDNPAPMRRHVALHEAGHAAISVLDSGGVDVPEYSTIIPAGEFRGAVASLTHVHDAHERLSYGDFRHFVRVALAGRAAEELAFGPEHIGNGAASDLNSATRRALQAFAEWGFAPGMTTPEASRSNLAVVVGNASPSEAQYVTEAVRRFLAEEYEHVLGVLREKRAFLEAIADRLLVDPVVDQAELTEICQVHGVPVQVAPR